MAECASGVALAKSRQRAGLHLGVLPVYRHLADLARAKHGVFLTADAQSVGVSARQLRRLVLDGWCERVSRGVFRVVAVPQTSAHAIALALALHGASAVVSHRTAAWAWGMPGFSPPGRPAVTVPPEHNRRSTVADLHACALMPREHVVARAGFPTTTPARTIFDLVAVAAPGHVEVALDHAVSRRLCSVAQVQAVLFLLARPGREGSVEVRRLLADKGQGWVAPASELERRARAVFKMAGLPQPQYEVNLGGADWIGRVDCLWRDARLVVELDGRMFHDGRKARAADRQRDNHLMALGWRILRFCWEDITGDPADAVATVRRALSG